MTQQPETRFSIVGFHGRVDSLSTPALRAGVFVDVDWEMVDPDTGKRIGVRISRDGELPGDGTRVGPWPATGEELVYGLSRTLASNVSEFWLANRMALPDVPRQWLKWSLDRPELSAPNLRAQRFESVRVLVAAKEDIDKLRDLVAAWARKQLGDELRRGIPERIQRSGWVLQRAARSDLDIAMVLAGFRRAGLPAERVERFEKLLPRVSDAERKALLDRANAMMVAPTARPSPDRGEDDLMSGRQRIRLAGAFGTRSR